MCSGERSSGLEVLLVLLGGNDSSEWQEEGTP